MKFVKAPNHIGNNTWLVYSSPEVTSGPVRITNRGSRPAKVAGSVALSHLEASAVAGIDVPTIELSDDN